MSVDCPICLETLSLSTPIGVCAPCGHPFHPDCFKKWQAANVAQSLERSYGQEGRAKCPSCNVRVDSFASNVFLGLSGEDECGGESDSDGDSLSSCDSRDTREGEGDDEDGTADGGNEVTSDDATEKDTDRPAEDGAANDGGDDSPDVICIDDDDDDDNAALSRAVSLSPSLIGRNERTSSTERKDKDRRDRSRKLEARAHSLLGNEGTQAEEYTNLRRKAKKFKRRVKMLEARSRERNEHHMRLVSRQREMETNEKELQEERDDLKTRMHDHDMYVEALGLDVARTQREAANLERLLGTSRQDAAQLRSDKAGLERDMVRMRERYKKALDDASTQGMAEVRELLDEHPKLVEENRRLQMQLNSRKFSAHEKTPVQKTVSAAKVAKEMRNLRNQQDEADKLHARRMMKEEKKRAVSKMSKKVSSQAARISRASKKAVARQNVANGALGRASTSSSTSSRAATSRGMHQTNRPTSNNRKRPCPRPPHDDSDDSDDEHFARSRDGISLAPISVQMSSSAAGRSRWNGSRNENNENSSNGLFSSLGESNSSRSEHPVASSARSRPAHQASGGASTGLALIGDINSLRRSNSITSNSTSSSRAKSSAGSNKSAGANRDIRRMFGRK